jgi:DNA replication licensing factor MCM4
MNVNPTISEAASEELIKSYVEMRQVGQGGSRNVVTATTRQLESLIRLSEALARMKFSSTVTRDDVLEASRLISVATQTAATDPVTGLIDMDLITTGTSTGDRDRMEQLGNAIVAYLQANSGKRGTTLDNLTKGVNNDSQLKTSQLDMEKTLRILQEEQRVSFNEAKGTVKLV